MGIIIISNGTIRKIFQSPPTRFILDLRIISLEVHGIWLAVKPHLRSEVAPHQQLTQGILRMLGILQIFITFEILRFEESEDQKIR